MPFSSERRALNVCRRARPRVSAPLYHLAHTLQYPQGRGELALGLPRHAFLAQAVHDGAYLLQYRLSLAAEHDHLAAAIRLGALALDPAIGLEPIEPPHQGRPLDADALGKLDLDEPAFSTREIEQPSPLGLAEPHRPQALVDLVAPGPRDVSNRAPQLLMHIHPFASSRSRHRDGASEKNSVLYFGNLRKMTYQRHRVSRTFRIPA